MIPAGALVHARSQQVDCALIDYNLGATLGTTLITRLREEGHGFPKIMITGYGDVRTATQVMKLGAADFIEKPYEPDELLASIDGAIDKARDSAQSADGIREARRMLRMLTERESEIVDAIVAGSSSKQIAEALSRQPAHRRGAPRECPAEARDLQHGLAGSPCGAGRSWARRKASARSTGLALIHALRVEQPGLSVKTSVAALDARGRSSFCGPCGRRRRGPEAGPSPAAHPGRSR